ncbi:UDP-glucose 4-epimerase GalE [Tateyamaria pelophila]|uniref:UDP-glucose 4-epimerase GalE n=1 Tax=Tateyamaria pelophila TaxID=328415 RepID=UPI001CBAF450|nr:UDP-glucose 4-epimerase GalE [Tateyamaria pelophila]
MTKRILVTGGAGFVGSHACKALAQEGYEPVVYDDLRRGNRWAVKWGPFVEAPLEDQARLVTTIKGFDIEAVMHFAAYAYVGESMSDPSAYFRNNVSASLNLLDAMAEVGIEPLVISSTCATYGNPATSPITEDMPLSPINPYGASKVMMEQCAQWYGETKDIRTIALRYFNAAGCDPEGEIGELHDPEPHLVPLVVQAALGQREAITVNGTDYDTPDGTAVRDYIHVTDLARAHILALKRLLDGGESAVCNLGTGQGSSILEIINAVGHEVGRQPKVINGPRRPGDPPALVADPTRAREFLGWSAEYSSLDKIARDVVNWYSNVLPRITSA